MLYLGRGVSYPIALEGALKLKEISYIHAEGYAAGELKHGPIASSTRRCRSWWWRRRMTSSTRRSPTCRRSPRAAGKSSSCRMPVRSGRGARLEAHLPVPTAHPFTNPLLYAVPMQLLAYHTAVFMGTDVDQPRNLAKSVTVE